MAEPSPDFPADDFRAAIKDAMRMGSPNQQVEKATFRWRPAQTFTPADPAGRPYDWRQPAVTDTTHDPVTLDEVAVEYLSAGAVAGTTVGVFSPRRATLTILDDERALIVGATEVQLSRTTWTITDEDVVALFDVDVYTLHLVAQ